MREKLIHSENIIIQYTSLINRDSAKDVSLSLSKQDIAHCTVFKELISQQDIQFNITLCSDVWLNFHLY